MLMLPGSSVSQFQLEGGSSADYLDVHCCSR
jgi:hypothetical protein